MASVAGLALVPHLPTLSLLCGLSAVFGVGLAVHTFQDRQRFRRILTAKTPVDRNVAAIVLRAALAGRDGSASKSPWFVGLFRITSGIVLALLGLLYLSSTVYHHRHVPNWLNHDVGQQLADLLPWLASVLGGGVLALWGMYARRRHISALTVSSGSATPYAQPTLNDAKALLLASDQPPLVRVAAARYLGDHGGPDAMPTVCAVLGHADWTVNQACMAARDRIRSRSPREADGGLALHQERDHVGRLSAATRTAEKGFAYIAPP